MKPVRKLVSSGIRNFVHKPRRRRAGAAARCPIASRWPAPIAAPPRPPNLCLLQLRETHCKLAALGSFACPFVWLACSTAVTGRLPNRRVTGRDQSAASDAPRRRRAKESRQRRGRAHRRSEASPAVRPGPTWRATGLWRSAPGRASSSACMPALEWRSLASGASQGLRAPAGAQPVAAWDTASSQPVPTHRRHRAVASRPNLGTIIAGHRARAGSCCRQIPRGAAARVCKFLQEQLVNGSAGGNEAANRLQAARGLCRDWSRLQCTFATRDLMRLARQLATQKRRTSRPGCFYVAENFNISTRKLTYGVTRSQAPPRMHGTITPWRQCWRRRGLRRPRR